MEPIVIGSVGVAMLLMAFVANLAGLVRESGASYLIMNLIGAGLAAWYAWQMNSVPFLILEGFWGLAAFGRLVAKTKKGSS